MRSLDQAACAALLDDLTGVAARAAEAILDLAPTTGARLKPDGSPVTEADEAAEAAICEGLQRFAPGVPIISEEQTAREAPKPPASGSYFLVDPLDGTREYIGGRDEYTVNIALMTDTMPLLGIIVAPAHGLCWRGIGGRGADRIILRRSGKEFSAPQAIHTRGFPEAEPTVLISRSHLDGRTQAYIDSLPRAKLVQSGSSIKFCRLAEGAGDLYPRLAPTRDWDVAAGHAILLAAGGNILAPDGFRLVYGSGALEIPGFLAWADASRAGAIKD